MIDSTIQILLTNQGIISRLDQDINDYLTSFGYCLKYSDDNGGTATLTIPQLLPDTTPIKTLHIYIHVEDLIPTIGPLIRTYLRLSDGKLHPKKLRAIVDCRFSIRCKDTSDKNTLCEETAAKKMAHHIHMIIRNSMGSALCLDFVVNLPLYSNEDRPLSIHQVKNAMESNIDTCYPCMMLKEHVLYESDSAINNGTTLHIHVNSRMCTVRQQPNLFRWLSTPSTGLEFNCRENGNNESMQPMVRRPMNYPIIIVACIEKVANLHRILMLCYDYDKDRLMDELDDASKASLLLLNVVVIMPRDTHENNDVSNVNPNTIPGNNAQKKKRTRKTILEYFEEAIKHFHSVVFVKKQQYDFYRPKKLIYEDESVEEILNYRSIDRSIDDIASPTILGIDLHPNALTLCGDYRMYTNLYHSIRQQSEYESQPTYNALQQLINADAIVFGYESTGIPDCIQPHLNAWVQIPCRSSINVVASMSIIFDALFRNSRNSQQ